ncbi:MAG: NFACT RNA binding domain-containing protein [Bacilli bacterium]|nr:NFACT RNA binding domain-containing protein [Bacilli bacterium]
MSMDGIFVHYLVEEFNSFLAKGKINKIYQPNPLDIVIQIKKDGATYQLLLSASLDSSRLYLTKQTFVNPATPGNFCMLLRKYIERGIITNIKQYQNDRIIMFEVNTFNELGDNVNYHLIIELMGRNSNVILIDENNKIIDAIRKLPPSDATSRYIIPKASYEFPIQENKVNPFTDNTDNVLLDNIQGLAKNIEKEIVEYYHGEILAFLSKKVKPTIYQNGNKFDYYCFDLNSYQMINNNFVTLSEMLDYYYNQYKKTINYSNSDLIKQVKRLITHQKTKLNNLNDDLLKAKDNIKFKDLGILLQANLYNVKKGMSSITVTNFLGSNEELTISLNPELDPSKNLKQIFTKGKKASNALIEVQKQIDKVTSEISYLEDIQSMIEFSTATELEEIKLDLFSNSEQYKNKVKKLAKKNKKLEIQHFTFQDVTIYIGKNNLQNDYLTNKLARNNDYWFHVKDSSGAHVIVSVPGNASDYQMNEETIRLAANLSAYYSKYSSSSSVPVDYTKVKYLKKIPGMKGYHVTYTNQKTIYIDPSYDLIKNYLRK